MAALSRRMRELRPPASTSPWRRGTFMISSVFGASKVPLAAGLAQQPHAADLDVMRQRLAHVVDRERGGGGAHERFHFHAGLVMHGHAADDADAAVRRRWRCPPAAFQRQRMAERNDLVRALGRHDAGDDGRVEHRAFLRAMTGARELARHRRR